MSADKHPPTQEFVDKMFSFSLIPNITKPTRITSQSATLIDNIFSNSILDDNRIFSGILYTDITDHLPIFLIDYSSNKAAAPTYIKKRTFSQENMDKFNNLLHLENWEDICRTQDTQGAYSLFLNKYCSIYDTCFPWKTIKNGYRNRKPWLSDSLKKQIRIKNQLYRQYKRTDDANIHIIYKRFRNKLNGLLFKAEKEHYSKVLNENKNNIKKSWTILKQIINKKGTHKVNSRFRISNGLTMDKKTISDGFNSFFVNVGPNLAKMIPDDPRSPTNFMKD